MEIISFVLKFHFKLGLAVIFYVYTWVEYGFEVIYLWNKLIVMELVRLSVKLP